MSGPEMLAEIERRRYYREQQVKSAELNKLFWTVLVPVIVIAVCLVSIAGHVQELWQGL